MPAVRAIVKTRELIFGSAADDRPRPRGMLAQTLSLGWVVLAEIPDREIVVGAVTKPWEANVIFRSVPPGDLSGGRSRGPPQDAIRASGGIIAWQIATARASAS